TDGGRVGRRARVDLFQDHCLEVQVSIGLLQLGDGGVQGNQPDAEAGGRGQVQYRGRRQAAAPEEGVDLAVLDRVDRFLHAEALLADVAIGIEAGRPEDPHRRDLGATAGEPTETRLTARSVTVA